MGDCLNVLGETVPDVAVLFVCLFVCLLFRVNNSADSPVPVSPPCAYQATNLTAHVIDPTPAF